MADEWRLAENSSIASPGKSVRSGAGCRINALRPPVLTASADFPWGLTWPSAQDHKAAVYPKGKMIPVNATQPNFVRLFSEHEENARGQPMGIR